MKLRKHMRLLIFATLAWLLFWIAGLPEYYQHYSTRFMVIFDLAILPPIWFIIYRSAKNSNIPIERFLKHFLIFHHRIFLGNSDDIKTQQYS